MFEFARQHSSVELVELHQLNQVGELGGAVIKAEEALAILFTLAAQASANGRGREEVEKTTSDFPLMDQQNNLKCLIGAFFNIAYEIML